MTFRKRNKKEAGFGELALEHPMDLSSVTWLW